MSVALEVATEDAIVEISDLGDQQKRTWPESILEGLNDMRQNHTLCDVVINTPDNSVFSVHSCVLGAGSDFFRQILKQSKTSNAGIVIRLEKSGHLVSCLLDFLYSGQMQIHLSDVEEMKQMAEGYGLGRLGSLCHDKLYGVTMTVVKTVDGEVAIQTSEGNNEDETATEYIVEMREDYPEGQSVVVPMPDGNTAELTQGILVQNAKQIKQRRALPRITPPGMRKTWRDYRYQCQYCRKVFTSLSRLKGHEATHLGEKRHECEECGAKFIQIEYLREHLSIHSDKRPFKCNECGDHFRVLRHLKKHMKVHSSDRPFKCVYPQCTATFKRSDRLRVHVRTHTGERPFPCPVCDKRFKCMEALTRHKKCVHNEDCPFRCGFCSAGFKRIKSLQEHMTVCDVGVRKTEHTCEHCGDLFKSRTTLVKHLRKHGVEVPPLKRGRKRKDVKEAVEGEVVVADEMEGEVAEMMEVQTVEEVTEGEVEQDHTEQDMVQHAIQLHELQQGGGDAAILLQRIANSDGEEAEALETALQLVQLEFVPGPGGAGNQTQTIQVVTEDGTVVQDNIQIQSVEEVTE